MSDMLRCPHCGIEDGTFSYIYRNFSLSAIECERCHYVGNPDWFNMKDGLVRDSYWQTSYNTMITIDEILHKKN